MPPKKRKAANSAPTHVVAANGFSKLKIAELKVESQTRNLEDTGRKADLLKRLNDYEVGATKKIKKEEDQEKPTALSLKDKLKEMAEKEKRDKKKMFQVDSICPRSNSGKIVDDYDCMLNQTNIGNNNNKFYIIQIIQDCGSYFVWNRWGRVGEAGANALKGPFFDISSANKEFCKKFKDKTKNNWDDRDNFAPVSGKYTLIEMDGQGDDNDEMEERLAQLDSVDGSPVKLNVTKTRPCKLDKPTQALIKLIFDNDMFKEAMAKLNIDVKKMPLGKLSKVQIAKGFEVLEEIGDELKKKNSRGKQLQDLTSRFFTLIPHNFGRSRPPAITDQETLQKKMDMLTILGDIEIAQTLQKVEVKKEEAEVDHPYDVNYGLMKCGLKHVNNKSNIYKLIDTYIENTKGNYSRLKLLDVWEVERDEEDKRFAEHHTITNRKLLWHGTNVAVVVAILKSGLRIMPHSGGRVGRGIYFASENEKSAAYVGTSNDGTGIMFLNEVVLGKQKVKTQDDSSLTKPPKGFDSVLAKGRQEPDKKLEKVLKFGEHDVIVPQGKPISTNVGSSSFHQSEYLVYKESQNRIRFLLKMKFC